jgi:aminoglycoside phosphotransferase family enzyme
MPDDPLYVAEEPRLLAFLADPRSYPGHPQRIETIETHMSRVFLAGSRVYKLKKPIRLSFVDLTTIDARRRSCERELALNQLLAPGVYLKVVPLVRRADDTLALGGKGESVDWLLVMRRLPAERLLHHAIGKGEVLPGDVDRICDLLGSFYAKAPPIACAASDIIASWRELIGLIEQSLMNPVFALPHDQAGKIVDGLRGFLERDAPLIVSRLEEGRIVDGHGDLRPEHIHLGPPVRVIDRLEFDDRIRRVDPFDEIGFLALECEMLGAPWIGRQLLDCLSARLDDRPPDRLVRFYRCYRAALRARLSIEHLRDPAPRTPERWPRQARAYLLMALKCLPDQS